MTKARVARGVPEIEELAGRVAWGVFYTSALQWRKALREGSYHWWLFLSSRRSMVPVSNASGVPVDDIEAFAAILKGELAENTFGDARLHEIAFKLAVSATALEGEKVLKHHRDPKAIRRKAGKVAELIGVTIDEYVEANLFAQAEAERRITNSQYRSRRPWF